MAIKDVSVIVSYIVETDHPEYPTYRRNGKDSWEQLMGMSWEEVMECEEIEEEFQREMVSNEEYAELLGIPIEVSCEEYAEKYLGIPSTSIPEFVRLSRAYASGGVITMKQAMETIATLVYSGKGKVEAVCHKK